MKTVILFSVRNLFCLKHWKTASFCGHYYLKMNFILPTNALFTVSFLLCIPSHVHMLSIIKELIQYDMHHCRLMTIELSANMPIFELFTKEKLRSRAWVQHMNTYFF